MNVVFEWWLCFVFQVPSIFFWTWLYFLKNLIVQWTEKFAILQTLDKYIHIEGCF